MWLVRAASIPAWRERLAAAGWGARRLGNVEDYHVFVARPPGDREPGGG